MFLSTIVKLIFGSIGSLLTVHLLGRKPMLETTSFGLVYTLVLRGILEESTYDDNAHAGHALFVTALQIVMIYGVECTVQKNEKANRWIKGEPSVLIKDGVIDMTELVNDHIEIEQLRAILRQQECFPLGNAKHAILENAGRMGVLEKSSDDKILSTLLVNEGQIQHKIFQSSQLDEP